MKNIVLASASPRRVELLKKIISDFKVIPCTLPEEHPNLPPKLFVKKLAEFKATNVFLTFEECKDDIIVIGSDTIVVKDGKLMGKPVDRQEAISMIQQLSGSKHYVYTGICLIAQNVKKVFCVRSTVKFFKLTRAQIEEYVDSGKAMDKAGAYGIQDSGFVKNVHGSIDCVIGLPTEKLRKELNAFIKKIDK